jgi:hypothetical protein
MYITEKKLLKWALYSNAIYVLLLFLIKPNGINIQKILITSLLLFSVLSFFLISIRNNKLIKKVPKSIRIIYNLMILWGIIIIVRSFSLSIQDWVTNFGNVYMAFAWFVPLALFAGLKIEYWNIMVKAIFFMFQLMFVAALLLPFYIGIETEWTWLLRPVNFILLMGLYKFRFIDRIKVYLIIGIYIVIAIIVKQRMEFLYLALVLGFLLLDKLFTVKIKRSLLKYIIFIFILTFTLIFTVGYEYVSSIISSIIELQDSRTFLFTELFEDINTTEEKMFGKGSLGTYYSQFFENTRKYFIATGGGWPGDVPIRITTEVGYLQMILKGGFVLLILNILIYIYAIYLALFKSKNKFVKRLGYFILTISILSLISFRPAFTPTFIIFWMAIGTVLNKNYREMGDEEIKKIIKF